MVSVLELTSRPGRRCRGVSPLAEGIGPELRHPQGCRLHACGIFVGVAINERPDLFAAAVSSVPVMDVVRTELDPNGLATLPEFGTVKDEAGFRAPVTMAADPCAAATTDRGHLVLHAVAHGRVGVPAKVGMAAPLGRHVGNAAARFEDVKPA
jgi:hypothetical protein